MTPEQAKLVADNVGFAMQYAQRYHQCCSETVVYDDLVQQGCLGMCEAAVRFDPARGVKFITYAVFWVRQSIHRYLDYNFTSVRVPMSRSEIDVRCEGCGFDYKARDTVFKCPMCGIRQFRNTVWLDRDTSRLPDKGVAPDEEASTRSDGAYIERLMQGLPERDKHILNQRYVADLTLGEIGAGLGLSRERIRQLLDRAMKHLRRRAKEREGGVTTPLLYQPSS
jgi:RNA polymerase primary sigma factor